MAPSTPSLLRRGLFAAACLLGTLTDPVQAGPPNAAEQFKAHQAALSKAAADKDWQAYLAAAERFRAFLNDAPTARLEVARTHLRLGDRAAALAETQRYLGLGQTHPILSSPLFEPLAEAIKTPAATNGAPVSRARIEATLADARLLAEDVDFDPDARRFFVTGVVGKRIISLGAGGAEKTFAEAPDGWPMVALKLDLKRRRLWATEVAFNGFTAVPKADWGRSALLRYDLDTGRLMSRLDGAPGASLGDMVLAANGDPIVADGEGGGLYRAGKGGLRRIDGGQFISPQTPAFCADPDEVFVPDYVRGLARMNLKTGRVRWLSGKAHALTGIDGLYCRGRTLFAVQNGASPARVVAFGLDRSGRRIIDETILERATAGLDDPTHGVLVGKVFYFIGNAGWAGLDDQGQWKADTRPSVPVIGRIG